MKRQLMLSLAAGALLASTVTADAQETIRLQLQNAFPTANPLVGTTSRDFVERVRSVSNGAIDIRLHEPGALVPALETFDAVSAGSIDMGWSVATNQSGRDLTFNFFGSVPFGPGIGEYMAWLEKGGGKELRDELYHKYNVQGITCGMASPEGAGWFKREINTPDDLNGLKIRFAGLGASVLAKFGAATQLIPAGEIYQALQLGTIDASEFSTPIQDLALGFYQVAPYYYMPGWHQQSTAIELLVNKDRWDGLTDLQKTVIEIACAATLADSIAYGESVQAGALLEMQEHGVEIKTLSQEFLDALREKWLEVVEETRAENPLFDKTWQSYAAFREKYAIWGETGYLK